MDDIIKNVSSLEKSGLLIDDATETVNLEIKKTRRWISWLCGCFIDRTYDFFIDTTCGFFIDKCYIWKKSHESRKRRRRCISFVISIAFNDKSYV